MTDHMIQNFSLAGDKRLASQSEATYSEWNNRKGIGLFEK